MAEIAERCNRSRHDEYTLCYWIRGACMTHSVWDKTGDSIVHLASGKTEFIGGPPYCILDRNAHFDGCEHENPDPTGPNWILSRPV